MDSMSKRRMVAAGKGVGHHNTYLLLSYPPSTRVRKWQPTRWKQTTSNWREDQVSRGTKIVRNRRTPREACSHTQQGTLLTSPSVLALSHRARAGGPQSEHTHESRPTREFLESQTSRRTGGHSFAFAAAGWTEIGEDRLQVACSCSQSDSTTDGIAKIGHDGVERRQPTRDM